MQTKDGASNEQQFQYRSKAGQALELCRADSNSIPKWEDVEYKQDGKHRLGYNPVLETKDISQEDLEAVRAEGIKRRLGTVEFKRIGGDRAALARL